VQALRSDGTSNIISTPSLITMNNEEAEVKVTQEIPLITGSYTSSTASVNGTTSPFETIQREEVGTILKVTPHISEGNTVQLKIEQEDSSPGAKLTDSADISTNKRSIKTTILIEDGGVIVLGGLMSDTVTESEDRVPGSARSRCSATCSSRAAARGRRRTCWCSSARGSCATTCRPRL
jgi:general secretion pathway protein D